MLVLALTVILIVPTRQDDYKTTNMGRNMIALVSKGAIILLPVSPTTELGLAVT